MNSRLKEILGYLVRGVIVLSIVIALLWLLQPKQNGTQSQTNGGKTQTATGSVPGLQIVREIVAPDVQFANNNQLFCSTTNVTNQTGGGTTYAAANGITLSQTTFKLGGPLTENTTIAGANKDLTFNSTGGAFTVNYGVVSVDANTSLALTAPTVGINNYVKVGTGTQALQINGVSYGFPSSNGSSNSYLKNDGSGNLSWSTVSGTGTVTNIGTGNGLSGGPITNSGTISVNAPTCAGTDKLQWNGTGFVCSPDVGAGAYTASNGISLVGTDFRLGGTLSGATTLNQGTFNLLFTGTGNVGIGNAAPAAKLSVGSSSEFQISSAGNLVRINNIPYSWPTLQGTAGQVLTNNGSGTLTWTSSSGTVTNIATGNGLTGGPITSTGTIAINSPTCAGTDKLQWNGTTFVCSPDISNSGTVTNVATGNGLSGGPITSTGTITINAPVCAGTDKLQWTGSTFVCSPDVSGSGTVTNVATGNGLTGGPITSTGTVAISAPTCAGTDKLQWTGTAFLCAPDQDTNTTYTASNGLTLTGTNFTLGGSLTGATTINQSTFNLALTGTGNVGIGNAAPAAKLSIGANSEFRVDSSGNLVRVNNIPYSWPVSQGTANQVLTNDGSGNLTWVTNGSGTGTVTNVATGNGLSGGPITSTGTVSINAPTCAGTDKLQWNGTAFVCSPDVDTNTTYTASNGLTLTGTNFTLGGSLTAATTISQAGFTLSLTGGNVGIGTTASASSFLKVGAATATNASINITSTGTGPTTPNSGDLWYTGTALNFRTPTTTVDLLNPAGPGGNGFVQFAPSVQQTTASTNSLINITTTGNTSNPLILANENGTGTPNLLDLQTAGTSQLTVNNNGKVTANGGFSTTNNLVSAGYTSISSFLTSTSTSQVTGFSNTIASNASAGAVYGNNIQVQQAATGTSNLYGEYIDATTSSSSPTFEVYSIAARANNSGSGTVSNLYGLYSFLNNNANGTVTNAYGFYTQIGNGTVTGTISNAYGVYVANATNANVMTNNYGIYLANQSAGTNDYGLYVTGADTASIYVASGLTRLAPATASSASLNIPAGSNPTTPNSGDLWYTGSALNFRNGGTTVDLLGGGTGCSLSACVNFASGSLQTTSSTNNLINIETTGNTANALIKVNEGGAGTPNLLDLQTGGTSQLTVSNAGRVNANGGFTTTFTSTGASAISANTTATIPANSTSFGVGNTLNTTVTGAGVNTAVGIYSLSMASGANAMTNYAGQFTAQNLTTVAGSNIVGVLATADNQTTSTVSSSIGVRAQANNSTNSTVTDNRAITANTSNGSASGIITDNYGITVAASNSGTITNNYGINISSPTNLATITNNYGVYVANQTGSTLGYGIYIDGGSTAALYVNTGKTRLAPAVAGYASLNIPAGVASPSVSSGDLWWTGTALNFRTASATVDLLNNACSTCFVNNGNSFGGTATLGTNDNNVLNFETNNVSHLTLTTAGDLNGNAMVSNGSTTTTGTGASTTTLTLTSTTNFDAGNLVLINGATYTRIVSVDSGVQLTVSPAVSWTAGQSAVEYTAPNLGSLANIQNRYDTGYFMNGIVTGSASTIYADGLINKTSGSLKINTTNNQDVQFGTGRVGLATVPTTGLDVGVPGSKTATGTISSSGITITGSGTLFTTELHVGDTITASGQTRTITNIFTPTNMWVQPAFSPVIGAGTSFTYQPSPFRVAEDNGNAAIKIMRNGNININPDALFGSANSAAYLMVNATNLGDTTGTSSTPNTTGVFINGINASSNSGIISSLNSTLQLPYAPSAFATYYNTNITTSGYGGANTNTFTMYGVENSMNLSANAPSTNAIVGDNKVTYSGVTGESLGSLVGTQTQITNQSTGTLSFSQGQLIALTNSSTGTVNQYYGIRETVTNNSTGNINQLYGVYIDTPFNYSGGTIANNYGVYVGNQTGTTAYGLYIAGATTNAIYSPDSKNYFGGVSVGTNTNTARLNLQQTFGTNAQIHFDGGGDVGSPVAGDMWFNSTDLKFRTSTATVNLTGLAAASFQQNGNSFGTLATLGTNDGFDLAFETNNAERMRISSTGNVGIGTGASPNSKLTVSGSEATANGTSAAIQLTNSSSGGSSWYLRSGATGTNTPAAGFSIADASNNYRLTIDSSGVVYLPTGSLSIGGTNANSFNLQVNGNIGPDAKPVDRVQSRIITTVDTPSPGSAYYPAIVISPDNYPFMIFRTASVTQYTKSIKCTQIDCSSGNTLNPAIVFNDIYNLNMVLGSDGLPVFAGFNISAGGIFTATHCGNAQCTSGNVSTVLDAVAQTGQGGRAVIGNDGMFVSSYFDFTNKHLKFSHCGNVTCTAGNTVTTVDATANQTGQNSAVAIGTDGLPIIGYSDQTAGVLKFVKCGNVTCTSGNTITTTGISFGYSNSISVIDIKIGTDGLPLAIVDSAGQVAMVHCTNASCTASTSTVVDAAGQLRTVSMALATNGFMVAVYNDAGTNTLKVLKCGNVACTAGNTITTIATVANIAIDGASLALGNEGYPVIAYTNGSGGLNVLKCADIGCTNTTTNIITGGSNLGSADKFFNSVYAINYYGKSVSISNFDLAEEYHVEDKSIGAGDVVRFKKNSKDKLALERASGPYDREVIGVISTEPGLYLKDWVSNKDTGRPVALAGRVPVKVTDENGSIKRGDYLTTSSTPGYAMKANKGGMIIGRAMEDFPQTTDASGNTPLVAAQTKETQQKADQIIQEMVKSGDINTSEVTQAKQVINSVATAKEPVLPNEGKIMMYVTLGNVSNEAFIESTDVIDPLATSTATATNLTSGIDVTQQISNGIRLAKVEDGQKIDMGRVVSMTGNNIVSDTSKISGMVYGIKLSAKENDSRVLGAYASLQDATKPASATNLDTVMATDNGLMWVTEGNGENLEPGDLLISSAIVGYAEKDPETFPVSYVIARVSVTVDWSKVTTKVSGKRVKLVPVILSSFAKNNVINTVAETIAPSSTPVPTTAAVTTTQTVASTLDLLSAQSVNINSGKLTIDQNGNFTTEGVITAPTAKIQALYVGVIKPIGTGITVSLNKGQKFEVTNSKDEIVLGVSESGSISASKASGSGKIVKGTKEIKIINTLATKKSKILITGEGANIYLKQKLDGSFIVTIDELAPEDIPFDYLIIN